jgi:hypothetical protein
VQVPTNTARFGGVVAGTAFASDSSHGSARHTPEARRKFRRVMELFIAIVPVLGVVFVL